MRTIVRRIHYASRSDVIRIVPLADLHLGNDACNEKLIKKWVDDIAADDHCYWIGMGDYCDYINRKDKRFDEETLPSWLWGIGDLAKAQRDRLIEMLTPIKGKCLALLEGNHERDMYHRSERNVYATMIEKLGDGEHGIKLDFSGFLRVIFIRSARDTWTLDFFLTHGWWGGRLYGNGGLNLERVYGWVDADMVLAGHDHKKRAFAISKLMPMRSGKVRRRDGFACSCGSFLDMPQYAIERGYRTLPIGPIEILVEPDKKHMRVVQ